jgi:hypothetical protein
MFRDKLCRSFLFWRNDFLDMVQIDE